MNAKDELDFDALPDAAPEELNFDALPGDASMPAVSNKRAEAPADAWRSLASADDLNAFDSLNDSPDNRLQRAQETIGAFQAANPFNDEMAAGLLTLKKALQGKSSSFSNNLNQVRGVTDEATANTPAAVQLAAGVAPFLASGGALSAPQLTAKTLANPKALALANFGLRRGADALIGGVQGFGTSEGDSLTERLGDALGGAGKAAAFGGAGELLIAKPLGAIASKGKEMISSAKTKALEAAQREAEKALNSARGKLGGESNAALHAVDEFRAAASNPNLSPELREEALRRLESEMTKALESNAIENQIGQYGGRLGRLSGAREAFEEAAQNATPEAIQAAQEAKLVDWQTPITSRLKRHISKYAPYLGAAADYGLDTFPLFTSAAAGAAAFGGQPMTVFQNAVQTPALRLKLGQKMAGFEGAAQMAKQLTGNPLVTGYLSGLSRRDSESNEERSQAGRDAFLSAQ